MSKDILNDPLLTRKEAAQYLKIQPGTLAVWDCTGRYDLKPIKVGNRVRYRLSALIALLEQQEKC